MSIKRALEIIKRQTPCRHENLSTNLGNGLVWARCEDCGVTIQQATVPHARARAIDFEEAVIEIEQALKRKAVKP